jgi:hypothetical protein
MKLSEMQLVCDCITKEFGNKIKLKRNNRWTNSVARLYNSGKRTITIAEFIFLYPQEVQLAEIIHEAIHHCCEDNILNHGHKFKRLETYWLNQFGLKPIGYKRAYYMQILTWNNKLLNIRGESKEITEDYREYAKLKAVAAGMKKRIKRERENFVPIQL